MLESVHIRGYRSLRDFRFKLRRLTIVTGRNGVGKSNLYRALTLIQRMADGRFAQSIAAEGGMPAILWAGDRRKDEPHRVIWELKHSDFEYAMECGLIPNAPGARTGFKTDPDIKLEKLHFTAKSRLMASRKGPHVEVRNPDGKMEALPLPFHAPESFFSELRDAIRFPAPAAARDTFLSWRFYHQFRTDADSPMRRSQIGFWSPVLSHDGINLAATLQSIRESGKADELDEVIQQALPGIEWDAVDDVGRFQLMISKPEVRRQFTAAELSDGTLRFFCLCAALITEKLPPLLVLNEPETSLHADLIPALASLIAKVPETTQLLIVTHSTQLAEEIAAQQEAKIVELVEIKGETRTKETASGKRMWTFDE